MTDAAVLAIIAAVPTTIASIGTLIGILNRRDIAAKTALTAATHVLVNDKDSKALKLIAEQAERIAAFSGLPDDAAKAVSARQEYNAKLARDATASTQGVDR